MVFKYLRGDYKEYENKLLSVAIEGRTRNNGLKLQERKSRFDFRKNFLTMGVVK